MEQVVKVLAKVLEKVLEKVLAKVLAKDHLHLGMMSSNYQSISMSTSCSPHNLLS